MEYYDAVVVGAGQAGLAVSHELSAAGIEHVVLERGRIGQSWRQRWDSFCLVTPNWTVRLPGRSYDGPDPDGFMPRDEIVRTLEKYAGGFRAPVRENVGVAAVESPSDGGFRPEYGSWLPWPTAFDGLGFPIQREGASTAVPGLFFAGVHFLRKRKSSLLLGVGEDAAIVTRHIAAALAS